MIEPSKRVHVVRMFIVSALGIGLVGCGAPPPRAELSAAEVAVEEAREADAAEHAPGPFLLAQDKLTRARAALEDEDHTEARRLAEQAEIDAQLAEAEARSKIAQARAAELRESIRILREEIDRREPSTS